MRRTPLKSENTIKPIIQQMLEIGGRATGVTIEEKPGGSTIFMVDVLEAGQKKEVRRNEEKRRKKKIRDEAKLAEQEIALKGAGRGEVSRQRRGGRGKASRQLRGG